MLTPKQEQFVQNIIAGMTQADAYRDAYSTSKMTDKTVWEKASRLMADDKVRARLQELRDQLASESIMTAKERLEYLTRVIKGQEVEEKVEVTKDGNKETRRYPPAIKTRLDALDIMNKMTGEYTTKIEGTVNVEKLEDLL
jgi:phage terminase small subunit